MAHGNGNTFISDEKLTALMKKLFTEELEKQQQSLLELVSSNYEITIKEFKSIKSEVIELKNYGICKRGSREEVPNIQRIVSSLE